VIGGDGGQSGFNASGSRIHTYTGTLGDINFRGKRSVRWNVFDVPNFQAPSNEASGLYSPMIPDGEPRAPWFIGQQHVWRTTDDLGGQAYMELHCNEVFGDLAQPLRGLGGSGCPGGAGNAGDLVSAQYGTDKGGSWVLIDCAGRRQRARGR